MTNLTKSGALALLFILVAVRGAFGITFYVTNTSGNGTGSLAQAIEDANNFGGPDIIEFQIPGNGPHIINTSVQPLPTITTTMVIDGYSQPSAFENTNGTNQPFNGVLMIRLRGYGGTGILRVDAPNVVIKGLNITNNNFDSGIFVDSEGTGCRIEGCIIGCVGQVAESNNRGIESVGADLTIGGTTPAARNVISGNFDANIRVGAVGAIIEGNIIGADPSGTIAVYTYTQTGIYIFGDDSRVGGFTEGIAHRNLISGQRTGIDIGSFGTGNVVQGNWIGVDIGGSAPLPNGVGIEVMGDDNVIGGTASGAGNLLGNADTGNGVDKGIWIFGANNTIIQGNTIGTDASGTLNLGNYYGIYITQPFGEDATGTLIGGTGAGAANQIAFNNRGVYVGGSTGVVQAEIRGNSIYDNVSIGLDLVGDSFVDDNDLGDADTGPNGLQNYPVLTGALKDGTSIAIEGTINSLSFTSYTLDFYQNPACDASGHGEGKIYLGSQTVPTDITGNSQFSVVLPQAIPGGFITATATSPDGETSEFSQCTQTTSCNPCLPLVVTNTNDSGVGSLRQAIFDANVLSDFHIIQFNIPGSGPHSIAPLSALPTIVQPVLIDGFSQPGAAANANGPGLGSNAVMKIEINAGNLGGQSDGLFIAADGTTARGLVINRAPGAGIALQARNCFIEGNYIGTDVTGTVALGNATGGGINTGGIRIVPQGGVTDPQDNLIGGANPESRNIISGNADRGINCQSRTTTIQGNFIGVDATGMQALPNNGHGVVLENWATDCAIGGNTSKRGNVISGNTLGGVHIETDDNIVRKNLIGTDVAGTGALGNAGNGITVSAGANTVIGGVAGFKRNKIAYNGNVGVGVSSAAVNTALVRNDIFDNSALGIDLAAPGPSPFPGSGLQNMPTISSVDPLINRITGSVFSTPDEIVTIDFFASDACDASGYGEGQTYLGSVSASVSGGIAVFIFNAPNPLVGGKHITATVTSPTNGTSEFSLCTEVINTPTGVDIAVNPVDESTGETPVSVTFDVVTVAGNTSVTTSTSGPSPPSGFTFGNESTYYDLSTNAFIFGDIEVCFSYDEAMIPGNENDLVLLHYNDVTMTWDNVTSSVDTVNNILCGVTTSFSPFAIAAPIVPTGIGPNTERPESFALYQNAPNPFNPTTVISYDVPTAGSNVTLRIYDVGGALVRTLVNGRQDAGRKSVTWDGRTDHGQQVATGVYFYRLQASDFTQTRKMILLK